MFHQVQRGDTLFAIARRYGVTVAALVRANRLAGSHARLSVGRRLAIPEPGRAGPRASTQATRAAGSGRVSAAAPGVTTGSPGDLISAIPEFDALGPAFLWPVDGAVTSRFGLRPSGWHRGIDIQAALGTLIQAAASGVVISSGVEPRYGRIVRIQHTDGFVTVYAHNEENRVALGHRVAAGETIATIGRTGHATTYHLHFEIRRDGRAYNPLYLLPLPPRITHVAESDEDTDE